MQPLFPVLLLLPLYFLQLIFPKQPADIERGAHNVSAQRCSTPAHARWIGRTDRFHSDFERGCWPCMILPQQTGQRPGLMVKGDGEGNSRAAKKARVAASPSPTEWTRGQSERSVSDESDTDASRLYHEGVLASPPHSSRTEAHCSGAWTAESMITGAQRTVRRGSGSSMSTEADDGNWTRRPHSPPLLERLGASPELDAGLAGAAAPSDVALSCDDQPGPSDGGYPQWDERQPSTDSLDRSLSRSSKEDPSAPVGRLHGLCWMHAMLNACGCGWTP